MHKAGLRLNYLIMIRSARLCAVFAALLAAVSCGAKEPVRYDVKVLKEYTHDRAAYTQGLFFHDGSLFETTGLNGSSSLRKVELESGEVLERVNFSRKYFAEGSVALDGKLYVLTWTNRVAFIYDAETLEYKQTYSYPREGWGLTTDGKSLIASDGSSRIYFMSPEFKPQRSINVSLGGRPIRNLNELEWIDGRIWANVYLTDMILIINPDTGVVEATVNCSGLLPQNLRRQDTDVLNGIAVDADGAVYLTGKNWPRLYKVQLVRQF